MRVTPGDMRILRRDNLVVRFAPMGPVAYVIAELNEAGSAGSVLELPCSTPHWGLVLAGELAVDRDAGASTTITAGEAFHVPPGPPEHRFRAPGHVAVIGFAPLDPAAIADSAIEQAGYELVTEPRAVPILTPPVDIKIARTSEVLPMRRGQIQTSAALMGPWIFCAAHFGGVSGYTSSWCDLPHWGTVVRGTVAIEWEDEAEIISAGEAYYCPPGPPGHRIEVTDAATIVDFTPIEAMTRPGRKADWRPQVTIAPPSEHHDATIATER